MAADLSQSRDVERVVSRILDECGDRVDVVVNNAGGAVGQPADADLAAVEHRWRRNFEANVLTAVLLTTVLLPRLTSPGGPLVTIRSIAALPGGGGALPPGQAAP